MGGPLATYKRGITMKFEGILKLTPQMVQPIANPVHLCLDALCMTSLINVRSLFNKKMPIFFRIIERINRVRIKIVDVQNGKHCASQYRSWA